MSKTENIHRIVIAGDLLPTEKNIKLFEKGESEKIFGQKVCKLFSDADFSIINLEGALTDSNEKQLKVGPILKAPIATINGIKNLGVKAVALANNHITDYCNKGYEDTVETLEKAGIQHVGSGYNEECIKSYLSIQLGNKKVCIYNVSETFFNTPGKNCAGCNLYDEWLVLNEIKEIKKTHDYIIVIYHGGAEEFPYPTPMVRNRFHRMAECGADFVTAQHTHCIGCEELYKDSYLLYGQGNFIFARMKHPVTKQGLITEISFNDSEKNPIKITHYRIHVSEQDILEFDENQDFSDFIARSKEIQTSDEIGVKYQQFEYHNPIVKNRFLKACQGVGLNSLLARYLPGFYVKYCMEKYSQRQLLRMLLSYEAERCSEDLSACLHAMLNNRLSNNN